MQQAPDVDRLLVQVVEDAGTLAQDLGGADARAGGAEDDDSENPQQEDAATAPETDRGETLQHHRSFRSDSVVRGLKRTGAAKVIAPLTIGDPDV